MVIAGEQDAGWLSDALGEEFNAFANKLVGS